MRNFSRMVYGDGLTAGVIGYGTVVVVMAVFNVVAGRSAFYTPALFGSALFYGLRDPAALVVRAGPVLAYNAAHLVAFLAVGLLAAWLVAIAERSPTAQYAIIVLLLLVAAHAAVALVFFARPLVGAAGLWPLAGASAAAAGAMGVFLWRAHPFLRRELREIPMGQVPPAV